MKEGKSVMIQNKERAKRWHYRQCVAGPCNSEQPLIRLVFRVALVPKPFNGVERTPFRERG